jgi:hypothetical protein
MCSTSSDEAKIFLNAKSCDLLTASTQVDAEVCETPKPDYDHRNEPSTAVEHSQYLAPDSPPSELSLSTIVVDYHSSGEDQILSEVDEQSPLKDHSEKLQRSTLPPTHVRVTYNGVSMFRRTLYTCSVCTLQCPSHATYNAHLLHCTSGVAQVRYAYECVRCRLFRSISRSIVRTHTLHDCRAAPKKAITKTAAGTTDKEGKNTIQAGDRNLFETIRPFSLVLKPVINAGQTKCSECPTASQLLGDASCLTSLSSDAQLTWDHPAVYGSGGPSDIDIRSSAADRDCVTGNEVIPMATVGEPNCTDDTTALSSFLSSSMCETSSPSQQLIGKRSALMCVHCHQLCINYNDLMYHSQSHYKKAEHSTAPTTRICAAPTATFEATESSSAERPAQIELAKEVSVNLPMPCLAPRQHVDRTLTMQRKNSRRNVKIMTSFLTPPMVTGRQPASRRRKSDSGPVISRVVESSGSCCLLTASKKSKRMITLVGPVSQAVTQHQLIASSAQEASESMATTSASAPMQVTAGRKRFRMGSCSCCTPAKPYVQPTPMKRGLKVAKQMAQKLEPISVVPRQVAEEVGTTSSLTVKTTTVRARKLSKKAATPANVKSSLQASRVAPAVTKVLRGKCRSKLDSRTGRSTNQSMINRGTGVSRNTRRKK